MVLLLARTHYSLLTAPASPRALCEEAVRRGCSHLVLTDGNGLYGLYPFAREAARVGLQAVFGCELVHDGRRLRLSEQILRRWRQVKSAGPFRDPDVQARLGGYLGVQKMIR